MKHAQAIKLAIGCLQIEIKRLAAQANLHDQYHADAPACVDASKRRKELQDAVNTLNQLRQESKL